MRLDGIKGTFYIAYPYEIVYSSLVEQIGYSHDIYGEVEEPIASPIPDVSEAFILPIDNVEPPAKQDKRMKTRTEKEAEWERMTCGKTWEELDHTDRIARTRLKLCGNIVYLYGVDHIVEKIHFVGKNNSYCIDYTGTKQELPAIFYDYGYFMAISAENMNDDRYDIQIGRAHV